MGSGTACGHQPILARPGPRGSGRAGRLPGQEDGPLRSRLSGRRAGILAVSPGVRGGTGRRSSMSLKEMLL